MSTYEPLPPDAAACFARSVYELLLDHALACNEAGELVDEAGLQEQRATNGVNRLKQLNVLVASTRQAAVLQSAARCAVSYGDQTVGVYVGAAVAYAVAAVTVLAAVAKGQEPAVPPGQDLLPSQVLDAPDAYFPLVVLLATGGSRDDAVTDQNTQLQDAHADLMAILAAARERLPLDVFDDPAALASRPATAVDLIPEVPDALHRFAAACAWAAAVAAKGVPGRGTSEGLPRVS